MADLSVIINGIRFENPVFPAAGPNVRNADMMKKAVDGGAGAIVAKTISVVPADDPRPTIHKAVCGGLMNCETWSEIPAEKLIEDLKEVKKLDVPLIASVGYQPEEVAKLGKMLEEEVKPDIIEFSVHYIGRTVQPVVNVAKALRENVSCPIWAKISPNFLDIEGIALALNPHVDGFVAINSVGPVLDFDIESGKPVLGSDYGQGWLSGPPIMPVALRIVYQISSVQNKPVIGVGGIENGDDAIKFFMAGASAIQVCSGAIKKGNDIYGKIACEISQWLEAHGYMKINDIRGLYHKKLAEREQYKEIPRICVDSEKCISCGICVHKCVQGALYIDGDVAVARRDRCIGCGYCLDFCGTGALDLK